jgi:predicted Zn-dependent protease
MRRVLQSGTVCLLVLSLAAVSQAAGYKKVTDQEEIATGRDIAQQIEPIYGGVLPESSPMATRVRRIGMALAKFSSRKKIHYSYKVLNNTDIMNAFAAPGGRIYITKKLVQMAANDAELAYVLGHETGHIDHRHMAQMVDRRRRAEHIAAVLGDSLLGKGKDHSTLAFMADAVFVMAALSYSRQHEMEADLVGVRWMSRLGYDPRAAIKILERMRKRYPTSSAMSRYFSTHPAPEIREAAIEDTIIDEGLMDVAKKAGGPRLWIVSTPPPVKKSTATITAVAKTGSAAPTSAAPVAITTADAATIPTVPAVQASLPMPSSASTGNAQRQPAGLNRD